MNRFIQIAIDHARTVLLFLVFFIIAGLYSYFTISKESVPDVKVPIVIVSLALEGISPEDSERLLVRPIERNVSSIEGIKEMRSTAFEGGGSIVLEFYAGTNIDKAKIDVRDKVDEAKGDLPLRAEEPLVEEVNLSLFPVLVIHLSGEVPGRTLYNLASDLQDEIEARVSTVLAVNIVGDREEVVEIIIDPVNLEGYGLSLETVLAFVQRNNQLISAGSLDTGLGRLAVKVPGLLETAQDILAVPLKSEGDSVVKFSDVATLHRTYKDPTGYARTKGKSTVALEIVKRTGENIIDTISAVRQVTAEMRKNWPKNVQVSFSQDESQRIIDRINELQNSLVLAVLLVMLVIIKSLGFRSALLVGLAVPGSFLMGILLLDLMDLTINIVVLFGLILSVGMLVDGAIIVVEYADRKMAERIDRRSAYKIAATRMLWPVVTSLTAILTVFAPMLFWPGLVGQFIRFLPITLIATLTASIAMAIIFIPTLGALVGRIDTSDPEKLKSIAASEIGSLEDIKGFTRWYVNVLEKALDMPSRIVGSAILLLIVVFIVHLFFGKGTEFFPNVEPSVSLVKVQARGNLSVDEKDALVRQVEQKLVPMKEFMTVYANTDIGGDNGGSKRRPQNITKDTIGLISLEYDDWQYRRPADEILEDIRKMVRGIPGVKVAINENRPGPPRDKPIQLELSSQNYEGLLQAVEKARGYFERLPGLTSIEDNRDVPGIDWQVKVDRAQAAKFGANVALIGSAIQFVTNGFLLDEFRPDDSTDEVDIIVRYPEKNRSLDQLEQIKVHTPKGLVPISSFIELTPQPRVGQIQRTDGRRSYKIDAELLPGQFATQKIADITQWLQTKTNLPKDISWKFKGEEEDRQETAAFLIKAFCIAIFLIAVILVTQFNSFFHMFLVLSSVVMSTIGVLIGLLVMNQAFGIVMGGIGIIALAGIIVSNNIILLDTYDRLSKEFKDEREVILRTGASRLRPVILTKLTAIFGLLPIMLGINLEVLDLRMTFGAPSTQWWVQLSTAIVFGILFASSLTLIVTPCALMLRHNFRDWYKRHFG